MYTYNKQDVILALQDIGIKRGDILFSHFNLGFYGIPEGGMTENNIFSIFYDAIFDVIGDDGALVVPTFTYSFNSLNSNGVFDYNNSKSKMGFFPEMIRIKEESIRTFDPIFSCSIIGNTQKIIGKNIISTDCFGDGSIWQLLLEKNAKLCNFNLDTGFSTFLHYCEKICNVPYRKDRIFEGITYYNGRSIVHRVNYFSRDNTSIYKSETKEYSNYVKINNLSNSTGIARGEIVSMNLTDSLDAFKKLYKENPYFFTQEKKKINA